MLYFYKLIVSYYQLSITNVQAFIGQKTYSKVVNINYPYRTNST